MLVLLVVLAATVLVGRFGSASTAATIRYVAPGGSDDGPGTLERPYRTLNYAFAQLRPGDTLLVRGGSYREWVNPKIQAGRADAPIVVAPFPNERPVVEGLLWFRQPTYWQVRGINVTWSPEGNRDDHMVKLSGGENWSFTDAEIWGARSYAGVLVNGEPRNFRLANLYVHDTYPANDVNQDHLIYVNAGSGGGVIERCLLVESRNGRAVKIGGADEDDPPVGNVVVRYNTMYSNKGPANVQLSYGSFDNRIEWNIMAAPKAGRANVTGFNLTGSNNVVANNVGFKSVAMVEIEPGLVDGGGNLLADPGFVDGDNRDFRTRNPEVAAFGRYGTLLASPGAAGG